MEVVFGEWAGRGTAKRGEVGVTAEAGAYVVRERSNVCAFRAVHAKRSGLAVEGVYVEVVDRDFPALTRVQSHVAPRVHKATDFGAHC